MHRICYCALITALTASLCASSACGQDVEKEADEIVSNLVKDAKDEADAAARILDAGRARQEAEPLREALLKRAYSRARGEKDGWPNPEVAIEAARALVKVVAADNRPEWQDNLLAGLTKQWRALKVKRDGVAKRRTVSPADKLTRDQEARQLGDQLAQDGAALMDEMLAVIDQWILDGRYEAAVKECVEAAVLEKNDLKTGRDKEIGRRQKLSGNMKQWKENLDRNPDSREARKQLIRGYVVYLDRPDEVLRLGLLSDSVKGDTEYADYQVCVPLAVKEKLDEPECFALGAQYYNWANKVPVPRKRDGTPDSGKGDPLEVFARQSMLRRAVKYYEEYVKLPPGPKKQPGDWDRVRANFQDANKQLAELQGPIDLLRLVDPARDTTAQTWSRAGQEIVCSEVASHVATWLAIPVAVPSTGQYEMSCSFRIEGQNPYLLLGLPIAGQTCVLNLRYYRADLRSFSSGTPKPTDDEHDVRGQLGLTAGEHTVSVCVVNPEGNTWRCVALLDGKPCLQWEGPADAIRNCEWKGGKGGQFGIVPFERSSVTLRRLVLTMHMGEADILTDGQTRSAGK